MKYNNYLIKLVIYLYLFQKHH